MVRRCWINFQYRGVLLTWITVGQGPIVVAVGAGGGCLEFFPSSITSPFFLPLSGRRPDIVSDMGFTAHQHKKAISRRIRYIK